MNIIETFEQKKRRLFGKQFLINYYDILLKITKYKNENNIKLLSIVETDNIISKIVNLERKRTEKIIFNNKFKLKNIIMEFFKDKSIIYLCTDISLDCGILVLNSINDFNFDFRFEDEPTGVITLINSNSNLKILLDFYEENHNQFIEIEIFK